MLLRGEVSGGVVAVGELDGVASSEPVYVCVSVNVNRPEQCEEYIQRVCAWIRRNEDLVFNIGERRLRYYS